MVLTVTEAYRVLEITSDASEDEVKKAYKKLALRTHPDKNPGDSEAGKKFLLVSEAYKRITDPDSFKDDDEYGDIGEEEMEEMFNMMFAEMMGFDVGKGFNGIPPEMFDMMESLMMQGGEDDDELMAAMMFGHGSGFEFGGLDSSDEEDDENYLEEEQIMKELLRMEKKNADKRYINKHHTKTRHSKQQKDGADDEEEADEWETESDESIDDDELDDTGMMEAMLAHMHMPASGSIGSKAKKEANGNTKGGRNKGKTNNIGMSSVEMELLANMMMYGGGSSAKAGRGGKGISRDGSEFGDFMNSMIMMQALEEDARRSSSGGGSAKKHYGIHSNRGGNNNNNNLKSKNNNSNSSSGGSLSNNNTSCSNHSSTHRNSSRPKEKIDKKNDTKHGQDEASTITSENSKTTKTTSLPNNRSSTSNDNKKPNTTTSSIKQDQRNTMNGTTHLFHIGDKVLISKR